MNPTGTTTVPSISTASGIIWGSPEWMATAGALLVFVLLLLGWTYARARAGRSVRWLAGSLKAVGFAVLILSLLEPLLTGSRPKPGANAFVVLVDNSQSLQVRDTATSQPRAEWVQEHVRDNLPWRTRIAQDFDVRPYVFDSHLRGVESLDHLAFDGPGSTLTSSLAALGRRFRGLPLAGVLVITDGNRTDSGDLNMDLAGLPPIYPVLPPSGKTGRDIGVHDVSVSQTNFDAAPIVVRAEIDATGFRDQPIRVDVLDEKGHQVATQDITPDASDTKGRPLACRFQFRPDSKGVHFYTVHAASVASSTAADPTAAAAAAEQTLANNTRLVVVDQGAGPYRVLYVSGRPSWEFKFLRRAILEDKQVDLVGLIRIARRAPKFDFQQAGNRTVSPLFNNFDNPDAEVVESVDQPVMIRIGTTDPSELRDGFPKTAAALFAYHAVILDDVEASYFSPDQMTLLRNFVSQRGGGFLMLGGPDSFAAGKYDRTPIGDLLPVYLDRTGDATTEPAAETAENRLVLTREGWLQPWVRTRKTEEDERSRLLGMPAFAAPNSVGGIKPGATVLAQVRNAADDLVPALVAQPFGKGHVAALLIGDLWRWGLSRKNPAETDLDRSWRQTVRWLIADVPRRVEVAVRARPDATAPTVDLTIRVRDPQYQPLDDAKVSIDATLPDGSHLALPAEAVGTEPGAYQASVVTKQPGPYRFTASATAADGATLGSEQAGWAAQPTADEFARLEPNQDAMSTIARLTGGEVVEGDKLASFVAGLPTRSAPIVEPWTAPLWHQPFYFAIALACLAAEWGIRRVNGLA